MTKDATQKPASITKTLVGFLMNMPPENANIVKAMSARSTVSS